MKKSFVYFILILLSTFVVNHSSCTNLNESDVDGNEDAETEEFRLPVSYDSDQVLFMNNQPVTIQIDGKTVAGKYSESTNKNGVIECTATLVSPNGSVFQVTDIYTTQSENVLELQRTVRVVGASPNDKSFNSLYGFVVGRESEFADCEFFVPSVWYKCNFTPLGNIPPQVPQVDDDCFLYRNDRIGLPVVMSRNPKTGFTVSIIQKSPESHTVMADRDKKEINSGYRFGSLGVVKQYGNIHMMFAYPGTEGDRRGGLGKRAHPVDRGFEHSYTLLLSFSETADYASAVKSSWEMAFDCHDPKVYETDSRQVFDGLIETLQTYYAPSVRLGGVYDEPGMPFQVDLTDYQPVGYNYQMGFVGMQVATGYYLYRDGVEKHNAETVEKGVDVLNFWSTESLTDLGYPRCWYDPKKDGTKGRFRKGSTSTLRTVAGGMESLLEAWCFAKRNGDSHPGWIDACRRFGDWLTANQNDDGSWYFSYDHDVIVDGRHPVLLDNKHLTICAVRYMVNLYLATGNQAYRDAALRAGDFCHKWIHSEYAYVACVTDNPQTIDSESGHIAMAGFMSLYDLTGDKRWLTAAEQAATYAETWAYMHEIPVEDDSTDDDVVVVPKTRSMVGQRLIGIGHPGADLGFAWTAFDYYRLYIITGDEHYRKVALIAAHNTRQTMNWDGTLYPGQPRGLQLEAFRIMVPRRGKGVLKTLNWNYAAHLDPMTRFKNAFGTCAIEEVDRMPMAELQRLNELYSKVQSANLGD